jgi:hypothetical protein
MATVSAEVALKDDVQDVKVGAGPVRPLDLSDSFEGRTATVASGVWS